MGAPSGMQHVDLAANSRVILHIDFDCYYVQVEQKRLGIPRETPCAVQQWEGLIAVNYAARGKGIMRHMRVAEAKQKCPELVLVHVETIGAEGAGSGQAGGETSEDPAAYQHKRLTQKASLERYRRSTAEVLGLLHRLAPQAVIEKASIDEVYMDVTAMVDRELQAQGEPSPVDAFGWGSVVVGGPLDVGSEFERRLARGAEVACRLRGALLSELGYTASAGVACNKLLAKVGSALHKPNHQTVIPPRAAQEVMRTLPLKKLRNFGGKLGAELEELGCATAGEVQALPRATLLARFGEERAAWIEQAVRGVSYEPVQERERPKSMLAAKSFNPTSDMAAIQRWFSVLAEELAGRMAADEAQFRRRPRNLVVHYRAGNHPGGGGAERSKSCAMPRFGPEGPTAALLAQAALSLFKARCMQEALPCNRLAISAADFLDLPSPSSSASITRFLVQQQKPPCQAEASAGGPAAAAAAATLPSASTQPLGGLSLAQPGEERVRPAAQQPQRAQQKQQAAPDITQLFDRVRKKQRVEGAAPPSRDASPLPSPRQQPQPPPQQQQQQSQPPPPQQQQQQPQQREPGSESGAYEAQLRGRAFYPSADPTHQRSPGQQCQRRQQAEQQGSGRESGACSLPANASALSRHCDPAAGTAHGSTAQRSAAAPGQQGGAHAPAESNDAPPLTSSAAVGLLGAGSGIADVTTAAGAGRQQGADGQGRGAEEGSEGEAGSDALLAVVNLQEQKRILKEIELRRVLGGAGAATQAQAQRGGSSKPARQQAAGARGDKRQSSIAAFLHKGS